MPTITIGNNTGNTAGILDAQIKNYFPTNNYGGSNSFEITKYYPLDHTHTLLKIDNISAIPAGSIITSVAIYLYLTFAGAADAHTVTLKRLLRNWVEGTLDDANRTGDDPDSCCWDEYGSGNAWTTAGALSDDNDRSSTVSATASINNTTGEYKAIASSSQLVQDVQNWLNGTWSNYGWHFERTAGGDDGQYRRFASSEGADGQRPYIVIEYTAGEKYVDLSLICESEAGNIFNIIRLRNLNFEILSEIRINTYLTRIRVLTLLITAETEILINLLRLRNLLFQIFTEAEIDAIITKIAGLIFECKSETNININLSRIVDLIMTVLSITEITLILTLTNEIINIIKSLSGFMRDEINDSFGKDYQYSEFSREIINEGFTEVL